MTPRWLALSLAVALGAAVMPARAAGPSAADKETARTLMEEGRELRDKKDLRGALDRFQRADAIMHVPSTGYELARIQVALGLLVEARDTLARVLRSPNPNEPQPFRIARKNAQDLDDSLAGRIPGLTIVVKGAPADESLTITVDDVEVPTAELGVPRRVNAGHHVVVAKVPNGQGRAEVDVKEGETKQVPVELVITGPPPTAAAPVPEPVPDTGSPSGETPPPQPHRSHLLTYLGFGVGIVGVGVGAATGILTLTTKSNLSSECNSSSQCPPSAYSDLDKANTFATISTVAFIVGGVGLGVGVVSLFVGGKSAPKKDAAGSHVQVTPWLGLGSAGVHGQF